MTPSELSTQELDLPEGPLEREACPGDPWADVRGVDIWVLGVRLPPPRCVDTPCRGERSRQALQVQSQIPEWPPWEGPQEPPGAKGQA